jgi:hypothetical protein
MPTMVVATPRSNARVGAPRPEAYSRIRSALFSAYESRLKRSIRLPIGPRPARRSVMICGKSAMTRLPSRTSGTTNSVTSPAISPNATRNTSSVASQRLIHRARDSIQLTTGCSATAKNAAMTIQVNTWRVSRTRNSSSSSVASARPMTTSVRRAITAVSFSSLMARRVPAAALGKRSHDGRSRHCG